MKLSNQPLASLTLITILFIALTKQFSFQNGIPTCNNYVINTYLYLALSILILGISIYLFDFSLLELNQPLYLIPYFLVTFGIIIFITMQNDYQKTMREVVVSHISWILFVALISLMMTHYFKNPIYSEHISSAIIIVALIFTVMSGVVYAYPSFFEKSYSAMSLALLVALITIIIIEIGSLLFMSFGNFSIKDTLALFRFTSYIVILIFSLFISYDTIRMFELAKACKNMPNYPKASVGFFLDVINLFKRILFLQSR